MFFIFSEDHENMEGLDKSLCGTLKLALLGFHINCEPNPLIHPIDVPLSLNLTLKAPRKMYLKMSSAEVVCCK